MDYEPILIELKTPQARENLLKFLAEQKRKFKELTEDPKLKTPTLRKFDSRFLDEKKFKQQKSESDLNYILSSKIPHRICQTICSNKKVAR